MTIYCRATEQQEAILREVVSDYHERLVRAGVTIDLLEARSELDDEGEPKGDALTHGGYGALAIARVVNHRDRVKGCADVSIEIDGRWWEEASDEERKALVDHELTHFEVVYEDVEQEIPKYDLGGRPKLKIRKHDRQYGWFDEIAERWGTASQEHQGARQMLSETVRGMYQLDLFTADIGGEEVAA